MVLGCKVVVEGVSVVVVDSTVVVVVVVGGRVGPGEDVVGVGGRVVVGLGRVVVGVVGAGWVGPGAGRFAVVVVVVGGGSSGRTENDGAEVVGANGAPRVVVVASPIAPGTVVPVGGGRTGVRPPPSSGGGAASDDVAVDLPVHQLTPTVTANRRPPARATMTSPEMKRPTSTLLRHENPACSGVDCERCSATRLARSSGLRRPLPCGSGNSADPSFSLALSPGKSYADQARQSTIR